MADGDPPAAAGLGAARSMECEEEEASGVAEGNAAEQEDVWRQTMRKCAFRTLMVGPTGVFEGVANMYASGLLISPAHCLISNVGSGSAPAAAAAGDDDEAAPAPAAAAAAAGGVAGGGGAGGDDEAAAKSYAQTFVLHSDSFSWSRSSAGLPVFVWADGALADFAVVSFRGLIPAVPAPEDGPPKTVPNLAEMLKLEDVKSLVFAHDDTLREILTGDTEKVMYVPRSVVGAGEEQFLAVTIKAFETVDKQVKQDLDQQPGFDYFKPRLDNMYVVRPGEDGDRLAMGMSGSLIACQAGEDSCAPLAVLVWASSDGSCGLAIAVEFGGPVSSHSIIMALTAATGADQARGNALQNGLYLLGDFPDSTTNFYEGFPSPPAPIPFPPASWRPPSGLLERLCNTSGLVRLIDGFAFLQVMQRLPPDLGTPQAVRYGGSEACPTGGALRFFFTQLLDTQQAADAHAQVILRRFTKQRPQGDVNAGTRELLKDIAPSLLDYYDRLNAHAWLALHVHMDKAGGVLNRGFSIRLDYKPTNGTPPGTSRPYKDPFPDEDTGDRFKTVVLSIINGQARLTRAFQLAHWPKQQAAGLAATDRYDDWVGWPDWTDGVKRTYVVEVLSGDRRLLGTAEATAPAKDAATKEEKKGAKKKSAAEWLQALDTMAPGVIALLDQLVAAARKHAWDSVDWVDSEGQ